MAFRGSHTVTMNLVLVFCLVAVINNVVTMSTARQMNNKNPSDHHEKGMNNAVEAAAAADPSNNKQLDKNQLPPFNFPLPLPLPFPFPRLFPGPGGLPLPLLLPLPIPSPTRAIPAYYMPVGVHPEDNIPGGVPLLHVPAPPPM